jgi:hypothetical protein
MYTKLDHKKKNYYTIQENKENKIKHNNIVDYVQIRLKKKNVYGT